MAHRPYPSRERALHQVERHVDEVGSITDVRLRTVTPFGHRLIGGADTAVEALSSSLAASFAKMLPTAQRPPVDEYRISTR